ncbi:hypothetical protein [uncultured Gammaproteobacteria bacterium]|nr:hypothetical protein [uncultured Gammaproteobacteria bacterium]
MLTWAMSLLIMLTISIQISLLRLAPIKMSQRLMILSQAVLSFDLWMAVTVSHQEMLRC